MSGPLQQLLGVSAEQRAEKARKQEIQISHLSRLLDDPNVTLDAKEAIAGQLEDLTQMPGKNKGLLPLFTRIFHGQQQQQAAPKLPSLYNTGGSIQAPEGVGEQTLGNMISRLTRRVSNEADAEQGLAATSLPAREARRGSLTSAQLENIDKFRLYEQQQRLRGDLDEANDLRTQDRQLAVARLKVDEAAKRLTTGFEQRKLLLGLQEQARARRDIEKLVAAGMTPEQASAEVLDKAQQEEDLRVARRQFVRAQTEAIPENLRLRGETVAQGWQRLDEQSIHNQVLEQVAANRGDLQIANAKMAPLLTELRDVRSQIKYFNSFPESQKPGSFQNQRLQELQTFERDLLTNIWQVIGEAAPSPMPSRESVTPRGGRPARGGNYVAPKVKQSDLNRLLNLP